MTGRMVGDDGGLDARLVLVGEITNADILRFIRFVRPQDNGCWHWAGGADHNGYPTFWFGNDSGRAMHFSVFLSGREIPVGHEPDHLCKNVECINPDHLEVVTRRENLLRGDSPIGMNARKIHCKNGHVFNVENTYYVRRRGQFHRHCRACCRDRARAAYRANPEKFRARKREYDAKARG